MAIESPGDWTRSWDDFTEEMWDTYRANYGPVWPEDALELRGAPGDETIYLRWDVNTSLPVTTTWHITYYSETVPTPVVHTGIISSTRDYVLDGLTNYEWYTVTLEAMVGGTAWLSDTVRVMPTDVFVYVPLMLKD